MKTSFLMRAALALALAASVPVALAADGDSNSTLAGGLTLVPVNGASNAPAAGGDILSLADAATNAPAAPTLKAGDPAPQLQTGRWIQGDPVTNFEKGKAYIVEFWATWCIPCRQSIPHLNEIHLKYKDKGLVVIGQDCLEDDETLAEPFVKKMGDKMTYRVALDDKEGSEHGKMVDGWMAPAGQDGIPTAFLVDTNGVIAWIGSPFDLKDEMIDEVLAGKFDIKKAAAAQDEEAKKEAQIENLNNEMQAAMEATNWDMATAKANEIEKLLPPEERDNIAVARFSIAMGRKDYQAAYQFALTASDTHKDNAPLQNAMAWEIVADPDIQQRDLAVAETIATRANDATDGKEPVVLNTLARALFMRGKKDEAIAMQTKAVSLADADIKDQLQTALDSYKKGELPKISESGGQ
jgi:thiol-disulfide isomerase/thioredoxin